MRKLFFGHIHADHLRFEQALDEIVRTVRAGKGGYIVTPNVDHVVLAEKIPLLRQVYAASSLSLVDGMPLLWLSYLLGHPLPEKISGSDLIRPLMKRAAEENLRVYFLGAAPGIAVEAAEILRDENPGLQIAGCDSPPIGFDKNPAQEEECLQNLVEAKADLVLMALGCPKQEFLMHRWKDKIAPCVSLGIGASLDFIAGKVKRSPAWMSRFGMEWIYRLSQDPKRLAKRYLIQDMQIAPIVLRALRTPKYRRIIETD